MKTKNIPIPRISKRYDTKKKKKAAKTNHHHDTFRNCDVKFALTVESNAMKKTLNDFSIRYHFSKMKFCAVAIRSEEQTHSIALIKLLS